MATFGEGSDPGGRMTPPPLAQAQKLEASTARRRLSQARHRATLKRLFNNLRRIVYHQSDITASKWQVLNRAKNHIQKQEKILNHLLKVKESFHLEDGNANSLEEVKEMYASMFFRSHSLCPNKAHPKDFAHSCPFETIWNEAEEEYEEEEVEEDEEKDQEEEEEEEEKGEEEKVELVHSLATLSPDLMEFERYLNFYKQTMDLLAGSGIVSSKEVDLPVVSAAISHLWQNLSEDRKAGLLEALAKKHSSLPGTQGSTREPACAEGSMKDSGVDSQGASCSLMSTPEEFLFEDAFDVACFLDKCEDPSTSSPSSFFAGCNPEEPEEKFQLYRQIIDYFNGLCCVNTQLKQGSDKEARGPEQQRLRLQPYPEPDPPPMDDEMLMLQCMETFDDEDL